MSVICLCTNEKLNANLHVLALKVRIKVIRYLSRQFLNFFYSGFPCVYSVFFPNFFIYFYLIVNVKAKICFVLYFLKLYSKSTPFNVVPEAINPAVSNGYHFLKNDV